MTTSQIIFSIYIYTTIAVYFVALPKIFTKAGEDGKKGYIPGYNLFVWLKILKQPWWWMFFFIPYFTSDSIGMLTEGVAFLMMIVLNVSTARIFKKYSWQDTLKMIFLPQWGMIEVAFDKSTYFGRTDWHDKEQEEERKVSDHIGLFFSLPVIGHALVFVLQLGGQKKKKTGKSLVKEWNDAILFAVVAASIIRSMVFEPFTIPTPSMEKDLLVGDYLFVSKMSYGPKLPNTPLSIPFFHNYIPVVGRNSYVEWAKRPYRRLPGVGSVERNEVVVFNFPAGDTAIFDPGVEGLMGHNYYEQLRGRAFQKWAEKNVVQGQTGIEVPATSEIEKYYGQIRTQLVDEFGLMHRPVDKRENYIKRCVAIAGDVLEIKDGIVHINDKPAEKLEDMQYTYSFNAIQMNEVLYDKMKEQFDIMRRDIQPSAVGRLSLPLRPTDVAKFEKLFGIELSLDLKPKGHYTKPFSTETYNGYLPIYPNHESFDWTEDNFGPLRIPEEGMTIELTAENWILYRRAIEVYEGNQIEVKDGKYIINGSEATEYTFKMNYYWLMGDNRHKSADSRFWGFVPEDHVVGKAVFVWMSKDPDNGFFSGGIRWNRVFTAID